MSITRGDAILATAPGLILSKRTIAGGTLRFGQIAPLTGPGAPSAAAHVNGARLAIDSINAMGGVLGKSLELVLEDNLSTGAGALAAFGRLAGRSDVVGVIGSVRSVVMHALLKKF